MSMRRRFLVLNACVGVVALLAACSSGESDSAAQRVSGGSVEELVRLFERGVEVDYDPLQSPREARQKADLIVRGVLTQVLDGLSIHFDDPVLTERRADTYATLVVEVTKVLSGNAAAVTDGKVYVEVPRSPVSLPSELSRANPRAEVVVVLDDLSDWRPAPNAKVIPPAGVPAGGHLFAAYSDGLWLQGPADQEMRGIGVERDELAPGWGGVRNLQQLASTIEQAGK